jgi:prefoldin beta subunit
MSTDPPLSEVQKQRYLQQLQQTIAALDQNKRALQIELDEVKSTLGELKKTTKGTIVYKQYGRLLIKAEIAKIKKELNEKKSSLDSYMKRLDLQYKRAIKKIQDFQKKEQSDTLTLAE